MKYTRSFERHPWLVARMGFVFTSGKLLARASLPSRLKSSRRGQEIGSGEVGGSKRFQFEMCGLRGISMACDRTLNELDLANLGNDALVESGQCR